ncbi:hypothetical protein ACFOW1_08100 [Parasediminibacterium paludis]|uniref:Lipoprotein n=1 Tax=Parasediminibacterium paludis TaxID=908966 RepID=A0ABV8PUN1_9BACT
MNKYLLIIFCSWISACSLFETNATIKNPKNKLAIITQKRDLSNKAMSIGPYFNTSKCEIEIECDCCASDLLFIDDKRFVYIAYCLESDSYLKGVYEANDTSITLHFDGKQIIKEHNLDDPKDSLGLAKPEFILKDTINKATTLTTSKYQCGKIAYYKIGRENPEYGVFDKKGDVKAAIAAMKKEQIWQRLKW